MVTRLLYWSTCESMPKVTKWLDYGKDHYATVSFYNAPAGRHVVLAWMSNWQYANQVPRNDGRARCQGQEAYRELRNRRGCEELDGADPVQRQWRKGGDDL